MSKSFREMIDKPDKETWDEIKIVLENKSFCELDIAKIEAIVAKNKTLDSLTAAIILVFTSNITLEHKWQINILLQNMLKEVTKPFINTKHVFR